MKILAPAKINLNLGVSAPIKDGIYKNYHNLDSLVVFADFGDELFFENSEEELPATLNLSELQSSWEKIKNIDAGLDIQLCYDC